MCVCVCVCVAIKCTITCSQLLYDIKSRDSSSPSESTVKRWIDCLNETLKCCLTYSERLASVLINRANNLRRELKNQGGRRRQDILSQNWSLVLSEQGEAQEEVVKLQQQVKTLQTMVQASSRALREIQETPSRKRTAKHYSKRHEKRIKKRHAEQCTATLSWLENEGLTPISVTVVNNETSELQTIWMKKDLEQTLNLDGEELSEDDVDLVSMLYVKDTMCLEAHITKWPLSVPVCLGTTF